MKTIIALLFLTTVTIGCSPQQRPTTVQTSAPRWEYKTLRLENSRSKFTSNAQESLKNQEFSGQIEDGDLKLNDLGLSGWEMVGCFTEGETTWPLHKDYKENLSERQNVRTGAAVLIFKRPIF